jgi:co-chaperonin GroES (HSP10)
MEDRNLTIAELTQWNKDIKVKIARELAFDELDDIGIRPVSHQILVKLYTDIKEAKAADLVLPDSAVRNNTYVSYSGQVIAMGSECFIGERFKDGARCKVGDYVMVMPGDGPRFLFRGLPVQFMYDDNVRCRLADPSYLKAC